jgi:RHS repeat-associated protein
MLTNGVWSYTYDAENRLVSAYSNSVCVVSNAYDYMSRRVAKWTPSHTTTFVYDGWNLVQEAITTASGSTTNFFVWGRDISGTMQGSGGVGGLLAVSLNGTWYFPFYDANGNITAYIDKSSAVVAEYCYDAFGGTIAQSGPMADTFAFRFSTKYFDCETGLYYYGMRFYLPDLHRWLNRDPLGEEGGISLYGFVKNNPIDNVDVYGLFTYNKLNSNKIQIRDGNPGKDNIANVYFSSMLTCIPVKKGNCYFVSCTLTEYSALITIDSEAAAKKRLGYDGEIGHEQIHIGNWLKFDRDLEIPLRSCEKIPICDPAISREKANSIVRRYGKLKQSFSDMETSHLNFLHPISGNPYQLKKMEEVVTLSMNNPSRADSGGILENVGYHTPTFEDLWFGEENGK